MNLKLETILSGYREEMIQTLQNWIRVPSVKGEPAEGAPFGAENRKMLDLALSDCARMGFSVKNVDGYAGHADLGEGEDREALAVLAHLDVVPVGDGWHVQPFAALRQDGKIYGRGSSDDKGPAVAALYALRAVKEAGIPLRRKVRLILGCDEECGSSDMAYYKEHETMPRSGFSPDADYPVINIEKGGCHIRIRGKQEGHIRIRSMQVGERANVIPGMAAALLEGDVSLARVLVQAANKLGFPARAELREGGVWLETFGLTGHAAFPESGRNAIGQLLLILKAAGAKGAVAEFADKLGVAYDGAALGIAMQDQISGKLTCNLGIIKADAEYVEILLDIRYPVLLNVEQMVRLIGMALPNCEVSMENCRAPHHVSEHTELVQELLEAYHEVTGAPKRTIAIGGGTYAQSLEEGVAFGALFPGEVELAHQADECIPEESLFQNARIFAYAIARLAGQKE